MKKNVLFLVFIVILIAMFGCTMDDPVKPNWNNSQTSSGTELKAGMVVKKKGESQDKYQTPSDGYEIPGKNWIVFRDNSAGPHPITSRKWTFGDGNSEEGALVDHKYEQLGNYEVKLVIEDTSGTRDSIQIEITVVEPHDMIYLADTNNLPNGKIEWVIAGPTSTIYGNPDGPYFHQGDHTMKEGEWLFEETDSISEDKNWVFFSIQAYYTKMRSVTFVFGKGYDGEREYSNNPEDPFWVPTAEGGVYKVVLKENKILNIDNLESDNFLPGDIGDSLTLNNLPTVRLKPLDGGGLNFFFNFKDKGIEPFTNPYMEIEGRKRYLNWLPGTGWAEVKIDSSELKEETIFTFGSDGGEANIADSKYYVPELDSLVFTYTSMN